MHVLKSLLQRLEVDQSDSNGRISDGDKITPREAWTWGIIDFFAVFPWPAFSISIWLLGSMLLALGLTVPQAIGASIVAYSAITVTCIATGHVGFRWHLSDPLATRLAWGILGYRVVLIFQIIVTTCWYAIQLVYGYLCVKVVIGAMIPSFITMPNNFSQNLPTNDFICMVIFVALSALFQSLSLDVWRLIGPYGAALTAVAFVAIVATCCGKAEGVGPLVKQPYTYVGLDRKPPTSEVVWGFFLALSSLLATNGLLYECNYTRFARTSKVAIPGQIAGHLVMPLLVTVFGTLATSAAIVIFPEEDRLLWSPWDLLLAFQKEGSAGARAATFFAGLVLVVPQLGINVAWNSYTTGISYSTLFPRWFTVRRGGFLTLVLGVAINPWNFANKPSGFNRFLNGTSIIYGALCGIFMVDYFVVRKTLVKVSDLLSKSHSSRYWYSNGINWRAVAALILAIWIPLPGWIMVIKDVANDLGNPWKKLYGLAWMLCFAVAGLTYYTFSIIWPISGLFEVDEEGREPCEDGSQPNIREGDIARAVEADKPDRQAEM